MALKDLLTAEGRQKFRTERLTKTLLERYAQSEARMEAAEKLKSIGTPQAIHGLARRFSATSENLGIDQEEKQYVRNMLVTFGDAAVEPVIRYIKGGPKQGVTTRVGHHTSRPVGIGLDVIGRVVISVATAALPRIS